MMDLDARYTVTREGTGHLDRQQVARFCGDWVGCAATEDQAWDLLHQLHTDRMRRLTGGPTPDVAEPEGAAQ